MASNPRRSSERYCREQARYHSNSPIGQKVRDEKMRTKTKTFPTGKTAQELFDLLGIQGGTCHQLPDLIQVENRQKRSIEFRTPKADCYLNKSGVLTIDTGTDKDLGIGDNIHNIEYASIRLAAWFLYYFGAKVTSYYFDGEPIYKFV